jgi:hypothetical protein
MNRKELAVTVIGLLATFALPWPCAEEPAVFERNANQRIAIAEPSGQALPVQPYGVREVRTDPNGVNRRADV